MTWPTRAVMSIVLIAAIAAVAGADQWNDRTILKFDAPMMVPGATLPPGTYTFKLMDSQTNRHVVQIFEQDSNRLVATTHAVPIKRMEPKGDVVLKLNPTEAGAAAAIKAWFYPGSLYGHQFVYPEKEAREIARRTKTVVLSGDIRDSDMERATLHTYDAEGMKQAWRADEQTMKEWEQWTQNRGSTAMARVAEPGTADTRESTAPMIRSQPAGMTVSIGDLEADPKRYIGQTINVTAEVEDVFGPRLFKIDEPNWADLDGEVLVYLPSDLAALVSEEDRVTVTGTMKMFMKADLEREIGWLEPEPDVEIEFADHPVLVATQIVGGDSDVALAIKINPTAGIDKSAADTGKTANEREKGDEKKTGAARESTVGTSGTTGAGAPLTSAADVANGGRDLVGRRVDLDNVRVGSAAKHGFWIEASGARLFVLPAPYAADKPAPSSGKTLSIEGVVLEMPRSMREKAGRADNGNDEIYVYATTAR